MMPVVTRNAVLGPIDQLFRSGTFSGLSDAHLLERFVATRDEAAFEAIITRHGRTVLAVCRDVLRDPHDAEDAFQATFLILARKAGSLWVGSSVSAWLHRVARRGAAEANRKKARRRVIEMTGLEIDAMPEDRDITRGSLLPALHEEIDRLPEKYRAPIVLCDLESLTRDEAACRLNWPPGTVAGRLVRARALLRDRLVRRGHVDVGGCLMMIGASRELPTGWIKKTVERLASLAGGLTRSEFSSDGGLLLARGVIADMMLSRLRMIAAVIVAGALPRRYSV